MAGRLLMERLGRLPRVYFNGCIQKACLSISTHHRPVVECSRWSGRTITSNLTIFTRSLSSSQPRLRGEPAEDEPIKFSTSLAGSQSSIKTFEAPRRENVAVVFLRGLPFNISDREIRHFIGDDVETAGPIQRVRHMNGRQSGNAFIRLADPGQLQSVLAKHRNYVGDRYIEVMESNVQAMEERLGRENLLPQISTSNMVRVEGLPYTCTKQDLQHFFQGIDIESGGILLPTNLDNKNFGVAFVKLASKEMLIEANALNKTTLKDRFVHIGKCNVQEYDMMTSGAGTRTVRMEGVPYQTTTTDVKQFFNPVVPKSMRIRYRPDSGLPSGSIDVEFHSHEDALKALDRDEDTMGARYVKLYIYQKEAHSSMTKAAVQ